MSKQLEFAQQIELLLNNCINFRNDKTIANFISPLLTCTFDEMLPFCFSSTNIQVLQDDIFKHLKEKLQKSPQKPIQSTNPQHKFHSNLLDDEEQIGLDESVNAVIKPDPNVCKRYYWERIMSVDYENPFFDEKNFIEQVKDKEHILFVFGGIENENYTKYGAFCSAKFLSPEQQQ